LKPRPNRPASQRFDDPDAPEFGEDPAAAPAQQLAAAQPGPDLDQEVVAGERPAASQEVADLLGGEGSSR
jgi:hypothetical protein